MEEEKEREEGKSGMPRRCYAPNARIKEGIVQQTKL